MPQNSNITLLDAAEIKVRFNDNEVLKEASLTIRIGDHFGMVGRNGSGNQRFLKSSLKSCNRTQEIYHVVMTW